jgi:hypothetical protein
MRAIASPRLISLPLISLLLPPLPLPILLLLNLLSPPWASPLLLLPDPFRFAFAAMARAMWLAAPRTEGLQGRKNASHVAPRE